MITDEHHRIAELRRFAFGEVVAGGLHVEPRIKYDRVIFWSPTRLVDDQLRARAGWLVTMAMKGPEAPVNCPAHQIKDRPDLWDACRKVSVASALLGRTCGAP